MFNFKNYLNCRVFFYKSICGKFKNSCVLCFSHFNEFSYLYMKSVFDLIARNADTLIAHISKHQQAYCNIYLLSAVFIVLFPLGCAAYSSVLAYESMSYESGSILLFRWFFLFLLVILLFPRNQQKNRSKFKKHSRKPILLYWVLLALFCFILLFPMLQFAYYGINIVREAFPFVVYLAGCNLFYLVFYSLIIRLNKIGYAHSTSDTQKN